ncbi:GNAT family N-acetyltransferase [Polaribacter batillariae]|uniref:GNAT family N-acetyltransferase n=1 Tax=Polaribacter batillariae TaxID=2808900 RepID=A0ABX7SSC9_9FLAO|nr:GNAT family N-acetyltransferase [Polaribacter batillariae]QTD36441.1 GNAT family N-acetyltransferase [Polaribacter batillariae]
MKIIRTNSENQDFKNLVKELDAYLKITDEDEHDFYNQFNNINILKHIVLAYVDKIPVGCGAIKKFDNISMELKRMYVSPENRGKGIAQKILLELEVWAKELGYKKCVLETGKRQKEAVTFYHKCNYKVIENYGQYKSMENSICFEKQL